MVGVNLNADMSTHIFLKKRISHMMTRHFLKQYVTLGLLVCAAMVQAQTGSVWSDWHQGVQATRLETGAAVAGVTALGAYSWDWGSSKKFKTNSEGWFGDSTGSGGAD